MSQAVERSRNRELVAYASYNGDSTPLCITYDLLTILRTFTLLARNDGM